MRPKLVAPPMVEPPSKWCGSGIGILCPLTDAECDGVLCVVVWEERAKRNPRGERNE
jgi:hypothetical protein